MSINVKRWLIGHPIATERAAHERLGKIFALPVFASDALSSVAYATGEIMAALLLAGPAALHFTFGVSLAICCLLVIVASSYRQTVMAYPGGGGAYIVARDNLGIISAQIAGAALMIDYILTVAVSVSSGVAALDSLALVAFNQHIPVVLVCLGTVAFITLVNLRGVKESGAFFALPTYAFITVTYILIGFGLYQLHFHTLGVAHSALQFNSARLEGEIGRLSEGAATVGVVLLLHAFASGCAALTGVEAISNGVTAFKEPSAKNAATTMAWMAIILGTMFAGLAFLAVHTNTLPETAMGFHGETTMSQIGRTVFGYHAYPHWVQAGFYWWLQIATALILVLAANTSFADFPRLGALIARDGFLPKQLSNMGDRLVFDRGIIALGLLSAALIAYKHAETHQLIPLYAVGVFLSFTMSQAGMVLRWRRLRSKGWHFKAFVNGLGSVVTLVVLVVIAWFKFMQGAWLVVLLIPLLVLLFLRIHAHYHSVNEQLSALPSLEKLGGAPRQHAVLVLVPGVTKGSIEAVDYARSLAGDCRAIHVEVEPEKTPALREAWQKHCPDVALVILEAPYRSVVEPLMAYLDEVQRERPNTRVTVVVPEFVAPHGWQNLLHGHTGLVLKIALLNRKNVVVTNVRYHLHDDNVSIREMLDVQKEYSGHM
ncbi:MAG TPA: APC family permease [Armatimonadota bacterium]|jgi:amino acid transporter